MLCKCLLSMLMLLSMIFEYLIYLGSTLAFEMGLLEGGLVNVQTSDKVHWSPVAGMLACYGMLFCGGLECEVDS